METSLFELKEQLHGLEEENMQLQTLNKHLNETVSWMHDLIWKMLREKKMASNTF